MHQKKVFIINAIIFIFLGFSKLFAFDWPQDSVLSNSFTSGFGEKRGSTISTSLVFSEYSQVKAVDDGRILIKIAEHDDMGWFNSTLGNALIVLHNDDLMSVYGNLEMEEYHDETQLPCDLHAGDFIGFCGNSGWQKGNSCLEFQVIDIQQKTCVNPRVLMPRIGTELPLQVGNIIAIDKNGVTIPITKETHLKAGQFYFYRNIANSPLPYKTLVSINGALAESICYDSLRQNNNRLCVVGNDFYPVEIVYRSPNTQLLANVVSLSAGKNILTITVLDILGQSKTSEYVLFVK